MRISDLLGADVLDAAGTTIGTVYDARLVQDGPPVGPFGGALRLRALLVGPTAIGARLGFERIDVRGPLPLRVAFATLHGRMRVPSWEQIASFEENRIRLRVGADQLGGLVRAGREAGRVVDAGLELLDRQMIDINGRMAGNVDDLELTFPPDGGAPSVTAILAGPGALARRIGGRIGDAIARIHERLQESGIEGPARISFGAVTSVKSDVRLAVSRQDLEIYRFERWARDTIIAKIPGS
jgi:sporulation protein YlmC with PRC-barrel domain